ncbi:SDR family oxidoreductase [Pseudomonadales bacterium]|nr:SDR family oxidoreductase [Pseudomonadales bacterium]
MNLNRTSGDIDFSSQTAALAWAPSDRVEVNLTYDHIGDRSQTMPQDPRFDGDNRFINLADKVEPTTYEVDQLGLRIDWDLSDTMTLHYVGGSDVERMTDDAWDRILDVNLKAVFKLSRAAIPHLKNSRRGRIVNIGSIMSYLAGSGMGAYTTSKHAVAGLTKTLALELGAFGITANYILPGAIATGITAPAIAADPSFTEFWTKKSAIGRLGQPEDIANAINFLLTAEAAFITAHGLAVDGGVMVNP